MRKMSNHPKGQMTHSNKLKFVVSKRGGVVHALAECFDCGWTNGGYKNAQATAVIHAKTFGHKVHCEVGINFEYEGRKA